MSKTKTYLKRVGIGLLAIVVLLGGGGGFYFKSYLPNTVAPKSFPQIDGEIQLEGLDAPVDVYRDEMGIPHIYATTSHDLFMAQGYIHAQDRFWQMDFWRHAGSGRLSEIVGEVTLDNDIYLRTLGWRQAAEQEYANFDPDYKAFLEAYAEGVNAYIQDKDPVEISLEYAVLPLINSNYTIEPWTPVNSLTWTKAMADTLGGNWETEIQRAILLKTLTPEQVDELFPPYPQDRPVIVPEIGGSPVSTGNQTSLVTSDFQYSDLDLEPLAEQVSALKALLGPTGSGFGSNSWAVSGSLTATGTPLLANDPHLGIQMPSIWYQVGLHCRPKTDACPYEVVGFSFAGDPGVVIGHNDRIAWGATNVGPDVMDLYIEKLNPDNPNQYEFNGQWVDFETRTETIKVSGGDSVEITVKISRHGPIVSDAFGSLKDEVDLKENPDAQPFKDKSGVDLPEHYAIALASTAIQPATIFEAIWDMDSAQNWEDFRAAAQKWDIAAQNLLYADVDGNIGYQMPGKVPIRKNGDGLLPVPGWTDEYDWIGYVPFEELPYALNPASGYIVTANNQVNPWDYPYLITTQWDYGQRAARIVDLIENAPGKIDIPYIQSMQGDSKSLNAEVIVPVLLSLELDPSLADVRDQFIAPWDLQELADSQSTAVFEQFWWYLLTDTFADDLPEDYAPTGGGRWYEVMRSLIDQPNSPWWDDKTTDTVETRDDIFIRAFDETVAQMQKEYGKNTDKWPAWGDLHTATFENQPFGQSGIGPIENIFNRGPFRTNGGQSIVNATGWKVGKGFFVDWLPSMRMIVDLGDLNNSLTVHTTGQSGHAYHPHYIDMAPLWAGIEYYPMLWSQQEVMDNAEGHLVLTP